MGTATHSADYALKLRRDLTELVGADDANILIANLSEREDLLASLGLIAGLSKLAHGEYHAGSLPGPVRSSRPTRI